MVAPTYSYFRVSSLFFGPRRRFRIIGHAYRSSYVSEFFVLNICEVDHPTDFCRARLFLAFFCEFTRISQTVFRSGYRGGGGDRMFRGQQPPRNMPSTDFCLSSLVLRPSSFFHTPLFLALFWDLSRMRVVVLGRPLQPFISALPTLSSMIRKKRKY